MTIPQHDKANIVVRLSIILVVLENFIEVKERLLGIAFLHGNNAKVIKRFNIARLFS